MVTAGKLEADMVANVARLAADMREARAAVKRIGLSFGESPMSIPLTARRDFAYAGRRVKKGQDFDARTGSDAKLLKAIGHAEDRPAAPAPQPYNTRMMTAATPAPVPARGDDLDAMDAEALHTLADNLGVYVHHRAGAERARQVIREHRKSNAE